MLSSDAGLAGGSVRCRAVSRVGLLVVAASTVCIALASGCGARSALNVEQAQIVEPDAGRDASTSRDAATAAPDASAAADAAVAVDAGSPVEPPPTTLPPGCTETDPTVRLLSDDGGIYEFDPLTLDIVRVGRANCGEELNSMSIDQQGVAFVSSQLGGLFRVDLASGRCIETDFDRSMLWGRKFTMGFVADADVEETLYIVEERELNQAGRLSIIDTTTFELTTVASFAPDTPSIELSGTGDGRIFGFVTPSAERPASLVEIDPDAVTVTEIGELPVSNEVISFDFAFWGGAFYLFTAESTDGGSSVTRFELPAGPSEVLGEIEPRVIGAGSSVCAPLGR